MACVNYNLHINLCPSSMMISPLILSSESSSHKAAASKASNDPVTVLPLQQPASSKSEDAKVFQRLRWLKRTLGEKPNKHDLAIMLVSACILEGLDRRSRIVGALRTIGLDQAHIVLTLKHGTGSDPVRHRWELDHEGRYHLHSEEVGSVRG